MCMCKPTGLHINTLTPQGTDCMFHGDGDHYTCPAFAKDWNKNVMNEWTGELEDQLFL